MQWSMINHSILKAYNSDRSWVYPQYGIDFDRNGQCIYREYHFSIAFLK